jgi:hypothetical protein
MKTLPLKITHGGSAHPDAFIASITVTNCRFLVLKEPSDRMKFQSLP